MSIRNRMVLSFSAIIALAVALQFTTAYFNRTVAEAYEELSEQTLPIKEALEELKLAGLRMVGASRELGLLTIAERHVRSVPHELQSDNVIDIDAAFANYSQLVRRYFPDEIQWLEPLGQAIAAIKHTSDNFVAAAYQQTRLRTDLSPQLDLQWEALESAEKRFLDQVSRVLADEHEELAERDQQVQVALANQRTAAILGLSLMLVAVVCIAYRFYRQIVRPLLRLTVDARAISSGKSEQPLSEDNRCDELGSLSAAFNQVLGKLLNANHQLETRVEEQQSELTRTSEQLVQAQKMDAFGKLTGGVAHEFNNLLTAILGFAQMAKREPEQRETVESCLDEVIHAASQAGKLTTQMLAFARKQVLEPERVNIGTIFHEAQTLIRPLLADGVRLKLSMEDPKAALLIDPAQLAQALLNLAINSVHAMSGKGVLVLGSFSMQRCELIDRWPDAGAQSYLGIFVRDNGQGMSAEVQQHIFEPFFTTKPVGEGTGLGLSMVYGVVQQSQGMIDVKTKEGEGTTIYLYLPLAEDAEQQIAAPVDAEAPAAAPPGKKILLAEDQDAIRKLARVSLEQMGYKVITASNGLQALEAYQRHGNHVDLLLTDILMPEMDGLTLAKDLKILQPDLKVVFMSGDLSKESVAGAQLPQAERFLPKPFSPRTLEKTIQDAIAS